MPSLWRSIRQRFGIASRPMTVRTHVAWYWRWLGMALLASVSLALAGWIYDAGARFAGFDRSEVAQEVASLRQTVARLEAEAGRLRAIADASESRLRIEQAAQDQLAAQMKALMDENARLKEDVALFDNLGPLTDRLVVHRFAVTPEALPGEYRYRVLLVIGGRRDKSFQGSLQFALNTRSAGQDGMILVPDPAAAVNPAYGLNFRYFYRGEGILRVPAGTRVQSVQVRVFEAGASQPRAVQNFRLP